MENYEKALNKFIEPWKKKKEVIAILLCGSYVTGNPTKHSDLDIMIVLDDTTNWRERGNKIIDGFLMEYMANPSSKIKTYFEEEYSKHDITSSHMTYTGRVVYSRDDLIVKKLKREAKTWLNKSFRINPKFVVESTKYHLWDMQDNLEEAFGNKEINFDYVYYTMLDKLKDDYFNVVRYHKIANYKTERFLFNKTDQTKYHVRPLDDSKLKRKFKSCLDAKSKKTKLEAYFKLTTHCLNKLGGFNINGWKLKGKL